MAKVPDRSRPNATHRRPRKSEGGGSVVGAAREKKGLFRLSLGLHSYHHQGYSAQLMDFIKAQAAARVGVTGSSRLRKRGGGRSIQLL